MLPDATSFGFCRSGTAQLKSLGDEALRRMLLRSDDAEV
jgi:hypothetical protein